MGKKLNKNSIERVYTPIGHHIYKLGRKYRVRASIFGQKYDEYFTNKAKAVKFRNQILRTRVTA